MSAATLRPAREADRDSVAALLAGARLPTDLEGWFPAQACVAEAGGRIIGIAGFERGGDAVLLRSVAVDAAARGAGLGARLVADRLQAARAGRIFLLTTDAAAWFERLGFARVPRESAPPSIAATRQFTGLCPASAICLARDLADG